MVALESTATGTQEMKIDRNVQGPEMQRRLSAVRSFRDSYWSLMNRTGFGSKSSTRETIQWLNETKPTDDTKEQKSIHWREDFIRKDGSLILQEGESLYQAFTSYMSSAAPYISKDSYKRWFERLYDTKEKSSSTSTFRMKMKWVQSELGNYVSRWKKVAEQRDDLVEKPDFNELVKTDPSLAILNDREKFLDLHYTERHGLVSKALALRNALSTSRLDLYASAEKKLESAAGKNVILQGKVGVWLDRIFASKASPSKILEFVNGSGPKSLEGLIQNWTLVKDRFDIVTTRAKERGANAAARGFTIITATQFLSMHYAQRLSYVKQGEERLQDAKNVVNELPIFLKIRHAMDMKDWQEASVLINKAKLMHIKESDWPRLKAMEKHVSQFRGKESSDSTSKVDEAKKRLDALMESFGQSHSEMQPLVSRLLRGRNANRNIHQLRWVWYNNIWCRTHGPPYLNDTVARKGSTADQVQLTKHRAEHGEDIGRHDSLDHATSDAAYFRKQEMSKHKATFIHANLSSGGVQNAFAEKMEHVQDDRWLYWTTFCPHSNGEPKSEAWMRDGLSVLTEMRSLTRVINNAGFIYDGVNNPLVGRN